MPEVSSYKSDPQRALAAWYLQWENRVVLNLFMTVGLMFLFALLIVRGGADDVEANLAKSRAAILAQKPADVDDADNAMLDYQAANIALVRFKGEWNTSPEYFAHRSNSAYFESQELKTYLQQNAAAIQSILQASAKPKCDWRLNYAAGYAMMLPHLANLRSNARLLAVYARECAHRGDHPEAARAIAAMYKMSRHAEVDPLLICGLVAVAISAIADQTIETIALWETPTASSDIEHYRNALWLNRDWQERAVHCLQTEKLFALYTMDGLVDNTQKRGPTASAAALGIPYYMGGAILWYGSDRRCCVAVMDDLVENIRHGKLISDESFQALIASHQTGPAVFTGMMLPTLSRTADAFARSEESARVTHAGLAWLLFRARYQRDPKSLEELTPEFLPAVPHGVFHDQPLSFRIDPIGLREKPPATTTSTPPPAKPQLPGLIRVYTLGKNGMDDQGLSENQSEQYPRTPTAPEGGDTGFRVPPPKVKEAPK